jgi:hypothetical protein
MVSLDDVSALVMELPEAIEGERRGELSWAVAGKTFAWERPLSKADIKRFGGAQLPTGVIVAIRVADLAEREAVLAAGQAGLFTIEHFSGYPAVLVQLDIVETTVLREALLDGWLAVAPERLASKYLSQ